MTTATAPNPFKGKASNKGGSFDQCPPGNHPGVMLCLIDLGTHWDKYQDREEKKVRKLYMVFEVEAEVDGKDRRFWIGKDFNVGLDDQGGLKIGQKSNLRQLLEGWRGKPYADGEEVNIAAVHGQPCLVNVIHEQSGDKSYARLKSAAKLPKGMQPIKPTKPLALYAADSQEFPPGHADEGEAEWMPRLYGEQITKVLTRSLEWGGDGRKEAKGGKQPSGMAGQQFQPNPDDAGNQDEIPF